MMDDVTPNSRSASEKSFDTEKLLVELLEISKDEKVFDTTGQFSVVEFLHPHQLQKKIDLKLKDEGCDVDSYALAGAVVTECCNTFP
ncbi:hypothetical protein KQX54_008727, partial [Cotesia glomerata]